MIYFQNAVASSSNQRKYSSSRRATRWTAGVVTFLFISMSFSFCSGKKLELNGQPSIDEVLSTHPRVLWVAAHPDDESMAGSILAKTCLGPNGSCNFLVFTHGEGGECSIPEGCGEDLGKLRAQEMVEAAKLYTAKLEIYSFFNAPLPVESFPTRVELEKKWLSQGDPSGLVARAIRTYKPDVVFIFDHDHGFTGHPEHQAAARFALHGVVRAGDPTENQKGVFGLPAHRVKHVYQVLNRYWFMELSGGRDPEGYTDTFDGGEICDDSTGSSCSQLMGENTKAHQSQENDMGTLRSVSPLARTVYLRKIDPWASESLKITEEIRLAEEELKPSGLELNPRGK